MSKGKIKFYNETKGFGFIIADDDNSEIFFHVTGVTPGTKLKEGSIVTYNTEEGKKGPKAVDVELA